MVNIGRGDDPEDDRLLYWDASLPKPALHEGDRCCFWCTAINSLACKSNKGAGANTLKGHGLHGCAPIKDNKEGNDASMPNAPKKTMVCVTVQKTCERLIRAALRWPAARG